MLLKVVKQWLSELSDELKKKKIGIIIMYELPVSDDWYLNL